MPNISSLSQTIRKKVVDLRVRYATLLKTKKKNEKSIENKSKVYNEANI
jgi:hypothetical protein